MSITFTSTGYLISLSFREENSADSFFWTGFSCILFGWGTVGPDQVAFLLILYWTLVGPLCMMFRMMTLGAGPLVLSGNVLRSFSTMVMLFFLLLLLSPYWASVIGFLVRFFDPMMMRVSIAFTAVGMKLDFSVPVISVEISHFSDPLLLLLTLQLLAQKFRWTGSSDSFQQSSKLPPFRRSSLLLSLCTFLFPKQILASQEYILYPYYPPLIKNIKSPFSNPLLVDKTSSSKEKLVLNPRVWFRE